MKKHAALLLAVALAGSMFLASCSGDGSGASAPESSGGTESQSASAEESSGAEPPELSGELVVMTRDLRPSLLVPGVCEKRLSGSRG